MLSDAAVATGLVPKERYTSNDWLQAEYDQLWPNVWQMACRAEELPEPGDFVEYTIGDQSVLILRDGDRRVVAYHNSCLHRGTRLASGRGRLAGEILCRFHGWSWHLDGSIREVPDIHDFPAPCVAADTLRLPEVHVGLWGGFVFVTMAADPPPLLDFLGPVVAGLAPFEPEAMRLLSHRTTVMDCNWKAGLDAFNEAYHIEGTHQRDLSGEARRVGLASRSASRGAGRDTRGATAASTGYLYELFETHNFMRNRNHPDATPQLGSLNPDPRQAAVNIIKAMIFTGLSHQADLDYVLALPDVDPEMPSGRLLTDTRRAVGLAAGIDYSGISDDDLLASIDFCIYPNMVGPISAGNWIVFRFRPNGSDPDSCLFDVYFLHRYGPAEPVPEITHEWYPDWRDHDGWGPTLSQDLSNMGFVQRGMHDRSFAGLRLNRQEAGIANHHRFLERFVTEP